MSTPPLFFQDCFGFLAIPYEYQKALVASYKETSWDADWGCTGRVYQCADYCHPSNTALLPFFTEVFEGINFSKEFLPLFHQFWCVLFSL